MSLSNTLRETILALEEKLLNVEIRNSPEALGRLLAEDFIEFGSSGRVYNRQQIIDALAGESERAISLSDFQVRRLGPEIVLATYISNERSAQDHTLKRTLRSSIWRFDSGRWQMVFHQGTPME